MYEAGINYYATLIIDKRISFVLNSLSTDSLRRIKGQIFLNGMKRKGFHKFSITHPFLPSLMYKGGII